MADLRLLKIPCGYAGLFTEAAPDALPEGFALEHKNFLLHQENKMVMRGPLYPHTEMTYGSGQMIIGCLRTHATMLVAFINPTAGKTIEPHRSWDIFSTDASAFAQPHLTMKHINLRTGAVTDVTASNVNRVPSTRQASIGNYTYAVGYYDGTQLATVPHIPNALISNHRLLRWTGTAVEPEIVTSAQRGMADVAVHYDKLFVLGSASSPNTLYFSDTGGPTGLATAADWQDDTTGLTNQIAIGRDDNQDHGVALAAAGQDLVIFKRHSIYVLSGYSSSTFTVRQVAAGLGCVDARSVIEVDHGVYFMSEQGYTFFDGAQFQLVSSNVRSELTEVLANTNLDNGGTVHAVRLPNDYILLSFLNQDPTTGAADDCWGYLFYAPAQRWSRYTSDATDTAVPRFSVQAGDTPYLLDGVELLKGDQLTRSYQMSHVSLDEFVEHRGVDLLPSAPSDAVAIPAQWFSALIRAAVPQYMMQLHRLFVHYTWVSVTDDGYYIRLVSGVGDDLLNEIQVDKMGTPANGYYRGLTVQDVFSEVHDAQLQVEWRGPTTLSGGSGVLADAIYDCFIEAQSTRQRRSS